MLKVNFFLQEQDKNFDLTEINFGLLSKYKTKINDFSYFDFILKSNNGGFFFQKSLQIYSYLKESNFCNIETVNNTLNKEYQDLYKGLIAFGQDIFGNQFSFDTTGNVFLFNIETSERSPITGSFRDWISIMAEDLDYYTGIKVAEVWYSKKTNMDYNQRLCPKIPFVAGGEYNIDNLYAETFPRFIEVNANIAKQVYNLPDGTKVEIKIKK